MSRPEKGGVPWDEIFEKVGKRRPSGSVKGKSGLRLKYAVAHWGTGVEFGIYDIKDENVYLKADADFEDGNFGLNLRTRGYNGRRNFRHPDLQAREFVGDALGIFQKEYKFVPSHFIGRWHDIRGLRDNYDTFLSYYDNGSDAVTAARQTWTAKAVGSHGFTEIQEKDIYIEEGIIRAKFWRSR